MQVGEVLAGKYQLIKQLGTGGEGSVFLAIHLQTEMFWAIKEIRLGPDYAGQADGGVCHELQMMKRLKNRHLPQIIDAIQDGACIWLVMEHVRGMPMDQRLKNGRVLSAEEVRDVAEQVTDALCYLESRQPPVCHLDIKPSNLIRRPDGLIKLVDFGSAWKEKEQIRRMGTDGYAAPEQYRADGMKPDVRTDLYALGATLYRMSTGKTWSSALKMSSVPNCPKEMSDLIRKCLEEDPADRFQSAQLLRARLAVMRRRRKRERGRVRLLASLAMVCPAAALCLQILPAALDLSADESWNYDKLVREAGVVSEEESRNYYRKAVFLDPGRGEAYLRYLSDVQTDGVFSEEEEMFLRDLLHTVRPGEEQTYEELLAAEPEAYLETALQIGLAYWYSCPREDSRRIALGWFGKALAQGGAVQEPDPVRKYESEGRSSFDYGTGIRTDHVSHKRSFIEEGAGLTLPEGTGFEEMAREESDLTKTAALYLELGGSLEKIHSSNEEEAAGSAGRYWENLGRILDQSRDGQGLEDPLMQLKFCRESLYTLTFLAGDLTRSGISSEEQLSRIREVETLARKTRIMDLQKEMSDRILEEIESAGQSAEEAVRNSSKNSS